jgi:hypothetical protein
MFSPDHMRKMRDDDARLAYETRRVIQRSRDVLAWSRSMLLAIEVTIRRPPSPKPTERDVAP